jgi:hypothetical protein
MPTADETAPGDGKASKPAWEAPRPTEVAFDPGMRLLNSLTRQKDHFLTMDGSKRLVWYM